MPVGLQFFDGVFLLRYEKKKLNILPFESFCISYDTDQDAASKDSMEQNIVSGQITYIKEHTDAKKILLFGHEHRA